MTPLRFSVHLPEAEQEATQRLNNAYWRPSRRLHIRHGERVIFNIYGGTYVIQ